MLSNRVAKSHDYEFADQALARRKRIGLTQRELADVLGLTRQTVHAWEAGLSYPDSEHLKQLLTLYLERGALDSGREADDAATLWEIVRAKAPGRIEPFDPYWFAPPPPISPPSSPEPHPTNFSPARTSFVGRVAAMAGLRQALDRTTGTPASLLTVTGVAGCGKTRLALTVADAVKANYPDGVWLVELAPLPANGTADPAPIEAATLAAIRLRERSGRTPLNTLTDHLKSRRLLLVLDNCEHVVAACAALTAQLLAACAELQILTTSQYPLGIASEIVWRLDMLEVPPGLEGVPTPQQVEQLGQSEAVQLFVQRARAVRPDFALSTETAAAVASICGQLDGLPLAIELAAAHLNVLRVDELLRRLTNRFTVLRRGGRSVVDRHQTLQATMDWSYRLLELPDQAVLRRLAVFSGGWDVAAAETVCAGEPVSGEKSLEGLDELVARSLIYVSLVDGVPRYGMLETVRQYGLQHLHLTGETARVRDRHLEWCVRLAKEAKLAVLGQEQVAWLGRLDREHDNLRTGLQWALRQGLAGLGLQIAARLWQFWRSRGYMSEGRYWFASLLALPADDDVVSLGVRASALEGAAWLAQDDFDFAQASALFAQSATLRRALGQDEPRAGSLINAALEARAKGDYAHATALLEETLAQHYALENSDNIIQDHLGLSRSPAYHYTMLALVLREQGHFLRATALSQEALMLYRRLGDAEGVGNALLSLCDIARDQGDTARVRAYGEESLAIFRDLGLKWAIGFALNNLAVADYLEGDLPRAARFAGQSEAIFRSLQSWLSLPEVLVTAGRVRGAQGEAGAARAAFTEALRLAWEKGPRWVVAAALEALGVAEIGRGRDQQKVKLLAAAARLRQSMGVPVRPADQPGLDRALTSARMTLGQAAVVSAWTAGESVPLEEAVAEAFAY